MQVIGMTVISAKLKLYIPTSASLKDKRQIRQSVITKVRQKFNAAIAEVDTQELHQTLTLGVAVVSGDGKHARQMMDEIVRFIEDSADAEFVDVEYL